MKSGIEITIIDTDLPDFIELRVRASNGVFSGETRLYAVPEALTLFAAKLQDFPANPLDTRDFELGTFNTDFAGGGARFYFRCMDQLGHAVIEVTIRSDPQREPSQEVRLVIPIEPAAVDVFVDQLECIYPIRSAETAALIVS